MHAVLTPRPFLFWLGLLSFGFFACMLWVTIVYMPEDTPPERRVWLVAPVAVGWSAMLCGSSWLMLAYFRESIKLGENSARLSTCFRVREIRLSGVQRAVWRTASLSLKILENGRKHVIAFQNFRLAEQRRLVEHFRARINFRNQEGWEAFEIRFVKTTAEPTPAVQRQTMRLYRLCLSGPVLGLLAGLVLSAYAARLGVSGATTWTGSEVVDCTAYGLLAGGLIVGLLWSEWWVRRN